LIAALRAAQTILNARAGKKKGGWGEVMPEADPPLAENFCPPSFSAAAEFRANKVGASQSIFYF
jgi:hypothetical protein